MAESYKGYRLVKGDRPGYRYLESPTEVRVALFFNFYGNSKTQVKSLVAGLDCDGEYENVEQAIRQTARWHERSHTNGWQRLARAVGKSLSRAGKILTALAAIATIVTFLFWAWGML